MTSENSADVATEYDLCPLCDGEGSVCLVCNLPECDSTCRQEKYDDCPECGGSGEVDAEDDS